MFCYRLTVNLKFEGLTLSFEQVVDHVTGGRDDDIAFSKTLDSATSMFRHIGWDGSRDGPTRFFMVPGPTAMRLGLILRELGGRTFVASPIRLESIEDQLDHDAFISHEELANTRRIVLGGARERSAQKPRVSTKGGWRFSGKGNLWTEINGVHVIIYSVPDGFQGILRPLGRPPIRTQTFKTQQAAQEYILDKFHTIINPRTYEEDAFDADDPWGDGGD